MIWDDLKSHVVDLQLQADRALTDKSIATNNGKNIQSKADTLYKDMNLRERWFGTWSWLVGGDVEKAKAHTSCLTSVKEFNRAAAMHEATALKHNRAIYTAIDDFLLSTDAQHRMVAHVCDASTKMLESTDRLLEKINAALSEIDDAEGVETLDLVTNNKGISMLSYLENDEASDAIKAVKEEMAVFQDACTHYYSVIKAEELHPSSTIGPDDVADLIFDMAFDGFDFMSLFTLSALNQAEDTLRDTQKTITAFRQSVESHVNATKPVRDRKIEQIQQACLKPG